MALQPNELFGPKVSQLPNLRAYPHEGGISVGTLAALAADADVAHLTPMSYADATGFWAIWAEATAEVSTITANATPATAGDFTLSVDGETTAAIAFDATAAVVQAALETLSNVSPGDVSAVQTAGADLGDASAIVTLTWGGAYEGVDVLLTANMAGLTGNAHVLAEATKGSGADLKDVDALLWAPDVPHAGLLAGETHIQLLKRGVAHAGDVPLPAGESQSVLDAALKSLALRQKGLTMQGLPGIA